jgi:transcription antitermination factor NusG
VRVIEGPFANFSGVVHRGEAEKQKMRVNLSIFGRSTSGRARPLAQVEKA